MQSRLSEGPQTPDNHTGCLLHCCLDLVHGDVIDPGTDDVLLAVIFSELDEGDLL